MLTGSDAHLTASSLCVAGVFILMVSTGAKNLWRKTQEPSQVVSSFSNITFRCICYVALAAHILHKMQNERSIFELSSPLLSGLVLSKKRHASPCSDGTRRLFYPIALLFATTLCAANERRSFVFFDLPAFQLDVKTLFATLAQVVAFVSADSLLREPPSASVVAIEDLYNTGGNMSVDGAANDSNHNLRSGSRLPLNYFLLQLSLLFIPFAIVIGLTQQAPRWSVLLNPGFYPFFLGAACALLVLATIASVKKKGAVSTLTILWLVDLLCEEFVVSALGHTGPYRALLEQFLFILALGSMLHIPTLSVPIGEEAFTRISLGCVVSLALVAFAGASPPVRQQSLERLIANAELVFEDLQKQLSISHTAESFAERYREQLHRNPPRNFDKWFEFARGVDSVFVDSFDQIEEDLEPFRKLGATALRNLTYSALSNPWNDVTGLRIRNGRASVLVENRPTHRWMMDGIIEMLSPFVEYLPEMDLVFNENDECRVAEHPTTFENLPVISSTAPLEEISDSPKQTMFDELSLKNTYDFSTQACHKRSSSGRIPSRLDNLFINKNKKGTKHILSPEGFIYNAPEARNPCGQPDLANLHGFFSSPASFKGTHAPVPIFSQSKVPNYLDINYPSAWNFLSKAEYSEADDVPWREKKSSIFWRGTTTEGVAHSGNWRTMARQRLVRLLSQPWGAWRETFAHFPNFLSGPNLTCLNRLASKLAIDVGFTDIVRCHEPDCTEQKDLFPILQGVPFEEHWKHKILVDMDGAGFSGRWIPFMKSKSLGFKIGLFETWADSRLVPWYHYVPVDVRMAELPLLIQYFSENDDVAERIARQGSEWANRVLRKEDMQVYMFRLLLEYGRLFNGDSVTSA